MRVNKTGKGVNGIAVRSSLQGHTKVGGEERRGKCGELAPLLRRARKEGGVAAEVPPLVLLDRLAGQKTLLIGDLLPELPLSRGNKSPSTLL